MIDWQAIKNAAKSIVADLTQLGEKRIRWADESEGSTWMDEPSILMRLRDSVTIGVEEERREDTPDGNNQTVTITAQKQFTLSIRCESSVDDIADKRHAGSVIEELKQRIARTSSTERLHGIFVIADYLPTKRFDYVDNDGRPMSAYIADFICLTVDNDVDDSADAGGFINEVIVSGTVVDGSRNLPVNLDVKGS